MISNCGKNEYGKYVGGQAGDQTGKEYAVIPWYNRPFNVVLRYPNKDVARDMAYLAREAALNDHNGYDQRYRLGFYDKLKNVIDWNPANITEDNGSDCSSSTSAIIIAAGHRNNVRKLRDLSPALTTKNMKKALVAAGFTALVDGIYTSSDDFLLPGDILLCTNHHVAINIDKGNGNGDKRLTEIAELVRQGRYGIGAERRARLTEEYPEYGYTLIQAEVNRIMF